MKITITSEQLQSALRTWEESARLGNWQPRPDHTPDQVAAANAKYLWSLLTDQSQAKQRFSPLRAIRAIWMTLRP